MRMVISKGESVTIAAAMRQKGWIRLTRTLFTDADGFEVQVIRFAKKVTLPRGSVVYVNAGTRLRDDWATLKQIAEERRYVLREMHD